MPRYRKYSGIFGNTLGFPEPVSRVVSILLLKSLPSAQQICDGSHSSFTVDFNQLPYSQRLYSRASMGDITERRSEPGKGLFNGYMAQTYASAPVLSTMDNGETIRDTQTAQNLHEIRAVAKELARDIVWFVAGKNVSKPPNNHARTLRRTVNEILQKHEILFKSIVNKLDIDESNGYSTFVNVVEEMFIDKGINWGRLVSVYAFAAKMGEFAKDKGMGDRYINNIAELSGNYVANKLGDWIQRQGGWDAFDNYFPAAEEAENHVWRGLLFTVFGLGALATMVAVR